MFQGQTLRVTRDDDGIAELCFDRAQDSINKFDARTIDELRQAAELLGQAGDVKGLLVTSAKDVFIVGADITEFGRNFALAEEELAQWGMRANKIFSAIEDLPFPSVTAVNGVALGGGFEMTLATDYRVLSTTARVGLPEVKLGIFPGFGGTVRLPRLIGADNAIEWIASGRHNKPESALKVHAADAVVAPAKVRAASMSMLRLAATGKLDWKSRRARKKGPLGLNPIESMMAFETAKAFIAGKAGRHYPAPLAAVTAIQKAAGKGRDEALAIESAAFAKIAKTPQADALIGLFLNDQLLKKKGKAAAKAARPTRQAAVLGAGIMGGGIAYQSATRGVPVLMKDIAEKQIELGIGEATKLLSKQVERGKLRVEEMGAALAHIRPTLSYSDFEHVDIVVEAVVENADVKKKVLAEVEGVVREDCIVATNTSSISIDELSTALKRPGNFLGMHFFNPVHRMPLVEVIYGAATDPRAIATVSAYASSIGKTPIVVKNCPGFLVNRILFPYFAGWSMLLRDGADFAQVDRVMEAFGWPMGPAYLQDVVGIDTSHHVDGVLAAGYPDRMSHEFRTALDVMFDNKRYGQKNGIGFYRYEPDKKGKPMKLPTEDSYELVAQVQPEGRKDFAEEEIADRLMIPMVIETARCLEEGIVETPAEADMGLILGIGFPPFRGGALKYADTVGLKNVVNKAAGYARFGKLYEPTAEMKQRAAAGRVYFPK